MLWVHSHILDMVEEWVNKLQGFNPMNKGGIILEHDLVGFDSSCGGGKEGQGLCTRALPLLVGIIFADPSWVCALN
jgi:hypothetical protein